MANWEPKKWKGQNIERGQFITSFSILSGQTGLSIQNVRTSLEKLESTNELTHKSTNHFTLITVLKYNDYQDKPTHELTHQLTNEQHSTNIPLTTTHNNNNNNNTLNIYSNFLSKKKSTLVVFVYAIKSFF